MKSVEVIYPGPGVEGEARLGPSYYPVFDLTLAPPPRQGQPIEVPAAHYDRMLELGIVDDVPAVKARKEKAAKDEAERRRKAADAAEAAARKKAPAQTGQKEG